MAISLDQVSFTDFVEQFDPKTLRLGFRLVDRGFVQENPIEDDTRVSGYVTDGASRYLSSLFLVDRTLNMTCECGRLKTGPCEHVLALLIQFTITHQNVPASAFGFEEGLSSPSPIRAQAEQDNAFPVLFPHATPPEITSDWQNRLQYLTVKEMRELAAVWGVKLKGIQRDQVFAGLLEVVSRPEALEQVLAGLTPDASRVLDLLCAVYKTGPLFNGEQITPYLRAALGEDPKSHTVGSCLQDLQRVGLYSEANPGLYQVPLQVVVLPRTNPHLFKTRSTPPPQIEAAANHRFAQLALRQLLLDQNGRLQRDSQTPVVGLGSWPVKNAAEKQQKELEIVPEPAYLENKLRAALSRDLALTPEAVDLAARLIDTQHLWPATTSKKAGEKLQLWLKYSLQEHSRRLFNLALVFPSQVDLDMARLPGAAFWHNSFGISYKDFLTLLALARVRLVRLLSYLPAGQWVEISSILQVVQGLQPGWALEFYSRHKGAAADRVWANYSLWATLNRRRVDPRNAEDWEKSYGQFYLALLTRFLPFLGLLDVGLQNSKPVAVRLTAFGEFLINRRADFTLPAPTAKTPPLSLTPDGALELDLETAPFDLIQLLIQITIPDTAASSGPNPRRLSYRLNDTRLGEAFEAGWSLEGLRAQLETSLRQPLPGSLRERMEQLWNRFGRLQIYENMALIELADDYALPELLAGTSLSQILLYTFSPRLVAVRSSAAAEFIAEMQAKGYTPRVEGGKIG